MDFTKPFVAVNFKAYESATGINAVSLAATCNEVSTETQKPIIVCVPVADIHRVSQTVTIPVFSEHVDDEDYGAHTGKVMVSDIKDNGATGTLINHSEDQQSLDEIKAIIDKCKKEQIVSLVCASTIEMAASIAAFTPDLIAYEPPELIGGDVSVTTKPQVITDVITAIHAVTPSIRVLVGAGVKNKEDVTTAISLGASGVLLASGVTKAQNPSSVLLDLVSGL